MPELVSRPEFVVLGETDEPLVSVFRDHGIAAYVHRMPFGMQLPDSWTSRPSELISVGGSVSVEFAVPALLLARQHCPQLKYVHLTVDADDHFTTPETVDYEIVLNCWTETAEKYECQPWSDEDVSRLHELSRQSDFHYYVRSFYKKNVMILRDDDSTIVKYIGGMHDGETMRMQGPANAIVQLGLGLERVRRHDGSGTDVYIPRVKGNTLEYHFDRTERS